MAKQVSLKKMWWLCGQAIKESLKNKTLNQAVLRAYQLWVQGNNQQVKMLTRLYGPSLYPDQIEDLMIKIEKQLEHPVKDSDFLIEQKDKTKPSAGQSELIFYLHNIRSGFNIGSMIRLADGFHIKKIILGGYTADENNNQVKRAALGAENNINIEQDSNEFHQLQKYIQQENYQVVALETTVTHRNLMTFSFPKKTLLIVGNEKNGLPAYILSLCHYIVKIPMYGTKNSLNVVSALSIASYEWTKQWR